MVMSDSSAMMEVTTTLEPTTTTPDLFMKPNHTYIKKKKEILMRRERDIQ